MNVLLRNQTEEGEHLEASFLPEFGMALTSYKKGNLEIIHQIPISEYEKSFRGLGPMIGPHFHRRYAPTIPPLPENLHSPHLEFVKKEKHPDPFSHGIGRYAAWKILESTETTLRAQLTGKMKMQEIELSQLEGQNFKMHYFVELTPRGLKIHLDVVSDSDSIVGIHYYYHLPQKKGVVIARVKDTYLDLLERKKIPSDWNFSSGQELRFDLSPGADYTFRSFPDPLQGEILLDAIDYQLLTHYRSDSEENSWQLYHPKGSDFVCIEPVSSQEPRKPNLSVSQINIELEILV